MPELVGGESLNIKQLEEKISSLLQSGSAYIVIDLSSFERIYSEAVGAFLNIHRSLAEAGVKLAIIAPSQKIVDVLCKAGAIKRIKLFRSLNELQAISQTTITTNEDIFVEEVFEERSDFEQIFPDAEIVTEIPEEVRPIINDVEIEEITTEDFSTNQASIEIPFKDDDDVEIEKEDFPKIENQIKFTHVEGVFIPAEEEEDYFEEDIDDKELENLKRAYQRKRNKGKSGGLFTVITIIFLVMVFSFSGLILSGYVSIPDLVEKVENVASKIFPFEDYYEDEEESQIQSSSNEGFGI